MKNLTKNKTDALSNGDIERIGNLLDNRLAPLGKKQDDMLEVMATKDDLNNTVNAAKEELKEYIHEGIQSVMEGMDKLSEQLAEKEKVEKMESWIRKVEAKVGVKY